MTTAELPSPTESPRAWREAMHLTPAEVAERMRVELGEDSRHFTSVTKMENYGSYKSNAIRAYAHAVGIPFAQALEVFESLAIKSTAEKKSKKNVRAVDF